MGIHDDAREGALDASALNDYVRKDPSLLDKPDPKKGLTPLAVATIGGHVEEVELLLKKCARADVTSQIGETPLLLATRNRIMNRSRIVQLLLQKTPPCFVDATCPDAKNNTPLMFAIKHRDLDSIRLLRNAGACLTLRNNDDFNAKDLAKQTGDNAVERALCPDKEHSDLFKLARLVLDLLVFIITWVNQVTGAICRMYKLDPEMNQVIKQLVISPTCEPNRCPNQANATSPCDLPDGDMCIAEGSPPEHDFEDLSVKVNRIVQETKLERFFERNEGFMKEVTQRAFRLKNDKSTFLGDEILLQKTIKVSLHQQVVYCDDSSSMRANPHGESQKTLWDCQKELVERITQITTRILPEGEGIVLRFINRDVENTSNLTSAEIGKKLAGMEPVPSDNSHTKIGTFLRSKILKPLVYDKLQAEGLERPLLISVITDGRPNNENPTEFVNAILECGKMLEDAKYRREDVKFVIGQIGGSTAAAEFLETIRKNTEIASVVYCITDRLDKKFAEFRKNKNDLDSWLIDTLSQPIKDRKE